MSATQKRFKFALIQAARIKPHGIRQIAHLPGRHRPAARRLEIVIPVSAVMNRLRNTLLVRQIFDADIACQIYGWGGGSAESLLWLGDKGLDAWLAAWLFCGGG